MNIGKKLKKLADEKAIEVGGPTVQVPNEQAPDVKAESIAHHEQVAAQALDALKAIQ